MIWYSSRGRQRPELCFAEQPDEQLRATKQAKNLQGAQGSALSPIAAGQRTTLQNLNELMKVRPKTSLDTFLNRIRFVKSAANLMRILNRSISNV